MTVRSLATQARLGLAAAAGERAGVANHLIATPAEMEKLSAGQLLHNNCVEILLASSQRDDLILVVRQGQHCLGSGGFCTVQASRLSRCIFVRQEAWSTSLRFTTHAQGGSHVLVPLGRQLAMEHRTRPHRTQSCAFGALKPSFHGLLEFRCT